MFGKKKNSEIFVEFDETLRTMCISLNARCYAFNMPLE